MLEFVGGLVVGGVLLAVVAMGWFIYALINRLW